jgi:hypothetical protein
MHHVRGAAATRDHESGCRQEQLEHLVKVQRSLADGALAAHDVETGDWSPEANAILAGDARLPVDVQHKGLRGRARTIRGAGGGTE